MDSNLHIITEQSSQTTNTTHALESGRVVYLPDYPFNLQSFEQALLCESILDPKHKNISYNILNNKLHGVSKNFSSHTTTMLNFMQRYAHFAKDLVIKNMPQYQDHLIWGRTSYRPAEIQGRARSKRQDDTRLHVDAFPASPVHGKRILRVFCNINPHSQPRVWLIGEPFSNVLEKFKSTIPKYSKTKAKFLHLIKATKTLRSNYDHNMLYLHDNMKFDDQYQASCNKQKVEFPPQSTWIVFTDHVSHAALSGQYLLEQTFYLPIEAMHNSELSPLQQLVY